MLVHIYIFEEYLLILHHSLFGKMLANIIFFLLLSTRQVGFEEEIHHVHYITKEVDLGLHALILCVLCICVFGTC